MTGHDVEAPNYIYWPCPRSIGVGACRGAGVDRRPKPRLTAISVDPDFDSHCFHRWSI